ncbi:MAG: NtaA/DmoA family FMN-dependent monooxygenase [Brevibacterium aurantiacum]
MTKTLGFGVTASVTYEQPYLLARTLTTLDHFTNGRVAWNIVTSYVDSAARNLGLEGQIPHDERYDRADEYMDIMYKLFEGSITPEALRADAEANVFVDPDQVRDINHEGKFFTVPGQALAVPGPQGTPLLFQAGASKRGQEFALDHAEAIFFSGPTPEILRTWVDKVRDGLEERGRARDSVKIFALATVVVDDTDEAAEARLADYTRYVDTESALSLFGGWTGVDLSGAKPEDPLEYVATDANQSALASFTTMAGDKTWTIRDLAEFVAIGGRGPVITGAPATIADEFERWMDEADIDGFNIAAAVRPADAERFTKYVSPELRRRGLLPEPVEGATVREQLTGQGPRLADDHKGAGFRLGSDALV